MYAVALGLYVDIKAGGILLDVVDVEDLVVEDLVVEDLVDDFISVGFPFIFLTLFRSWSLLFSNVHVTREIK